MFKLDALILPSKDVAVTIPVASNPDAVRIPLRGLNFNLLVAILGSA